MQNFQNMANFAQAATQPFTAGLTRPQLPGGQPQFNNLSQQPPQFRFAPPTVPQGQPINSPFNPTGFSGSNVIQPYTPQKFTPSTTGGTSPFATPPVTPTGTPTQTTPDLSTLSPQMQQQIMQALGGGSPGGNTSGDNTRGPDNAGQPGSAGVGTGGLFGNPGNMAAGLAGMAMPGPASMAFGLIGNLAQMGALGPAFGPVANQADQAINPGTYGQPSTALSQSIATMTDPKQQQAAIDRVNNAIDTGFGSVGTSQPGVGITASDQTRATSNDAAGWGTDSGAGTGGAGGTGMGGVGGEGAGTGGAGNAGGGSGPGGGGDWHKGGIIPGPAPKNPNKDNLKISAQGGEFMMNRHAVQMFRPHLENLNRFALEMAGGYPHGGPIPPGHSFAQGGYVAPDRANQRTDPYGPGSPAYPYLIAPLAIGRALSSGADAEQKSMNPSK